MEERDIIRLPNPRTNTGPMSVEEAISTRKSVRTLREREALDPETLSQLFWAAQGLRESGFRNAPSAGALYPMKLFWFTKEGVFSYDPIQHSLNPYNVATEEEEVEDYRIPLMKVALGQGMVGKAAGILCFCADLHHGAKKFGQRAIRYALIEVGHAAQNVLLTATTLNLAACPTAAIQDTGVSKLLNLSRQIHPLYLVVIGEALPME